MLKEPKTFIIKQSNWAFGLGENAKILNDFGKMDCIGFLLKASGLDESAFLNKDELIDIATEFNWNSKLILRVNKMIYQTDTCTEIIRVNDVKNINIDQRKALLINLFATIGITLVFED